MSCSPWLVCYLNSTWTKHKYYYSRDLNTEHVQILDHGNMSGSGMFQILNRGSKSEQVLGTDLRNLNMENYHFGTLLAYTVLDI